MHRASRVEGGHPGAARYSRGVLLMLAALLAAAPIACRKIGGLPLPMEESGASPNDIVPPPITPELDAAAAGDWRIEDPGTPPFSRAKLLAAMTECTHVGLETFVDRARALEAAAATYSEETNEENLFTLRHAWGEAMDRWQELELFQFGPAAMSTHPGGRELRAEIYVWPLFSACRVDNYLTDPTRYSGGELATQLANTRGLGALEYLLFYTSDQNSCASTNPINVVDAATGESPWATLVASGLAEGRADYAHAAAELVLRRAETLANAWNDFRLEAGSTYPTPQEALNAVSDALFYLDSEVKDMKLAEPLGFADACLVETCTTESQFSGWSTRNIENNLRGFQRLFSGCNGGVGFGFDDLLAHVGQEGLAAEMNAALGGALVAVDRIDEPTLEAAVRDDPESVQALYAAIKAITDPLKDQFVTLLALDLPAALETDND